MRVRSCRFRSGEAWETSDFERLQISGGTGLISILNVEMGIARTMGL